MVVGVPGESGPGPGVVVVGPVVVGVPGEPGVVDSSEPGVVVTTAGSQTCLQQSSSVLANL